jgi:hypothetical protein
MNARSQPVVNSVSVHNAKSFAYESLCGEYLKGK